MKNNVIVSLIAQSCKWNTGRVRGSKKRQQENRRQTKTSIISIIAIIIIIIVIVIIKVYDHRLTSYHFSDNILWRLAQFLHLKKYSVSKLTLFLSEPPKTPANNDNGLAQNSRKWLQRAVNGLYSIGIGFSDFNNWKN
jgi:hypothetical protein